MKSLPALIALAALAAFALAVPAPLIAATEKAPTVAEATPDDKSAKSDDRDARPLTPQQQKMKSCNAQAKTKDLHGDERRAFMSTCLKG
jgi:hypothetical protein